MKEAVINTRLVFLIFIFFLAQSGSFLSQSFNSENISLICDEQPLRSVLEDIRIKAGINFIFQDNLIDGKKVTCRIKDNRVKDAVKKVLSGLNISCKQFGKKAFVLFKEKKPAKTTYKAIVVDQNTSVKNTIVSFVKPEIISGDNPVYPAEAAKNNIEGKVKVRFLISSGGEVHRVIVEKTSGSEILDSAAIDYINKLKFIPAKENGMARSIWMSMVLKYLVVDY
jgi:TonB family protein